MPQPIVVKSQSEQQSLPHLYGQAATRRFSRELAFDHREDGFYFGARPIQLPRVGRDHAVGSQRAAHVSVIGCGVELRVGVFLFPEAA